MGRKIGKNWYLLFPTAKTPFLYFCLLFLCLYLYFRLFVFSCCFQHQVYICALSHSFSTFDQCGILKHLSLDSTERDLKVLNSASKKRLWRRTCHERFGQKFKLIIYIWIQRLIRWNNQYLVAKVQLIPPDLASHWIQYRLIYGDALFEWLVASNPNWHFIARHQ